MPSTSAVSPDALDVRANRVQAVEEHLEVDLDGAASRVDAQLGDAADRHAPEPDRARDVQAADVLGGVGHHLDHRAASPPLNEEQRRREDDDERHDQEQAEPRVAFLDGHRSPH